MGVTFWKHFCLSQMKVSHNHELMAAEDKGKITGTCFSTSTIQ